MGDQKNQNFYSYIKTIHYSNAQRLNRMGSTDVGRFSIVFVFLFCSGCCWWCWDPPVSLEVAPSSGVFWSGIPRPVYLPGPCAYPADYSAPLSVEQLIDLGLRNNPRTRISWEAAKVAAYDWKVAQSTLYPTIDFQETLILNKQTFGAQADAAIIDSSGINGNNPNINNNTNANTSAGTNVNSEQLLISDLMFSYLLFDAGGRNANIESFRQAMIEANWLNNQVLQDVILDVVTSYYRLISDKALYEAKLQDLKDAKTNLDAANVLQKAGIKTRVDVLRASSDYVNTELQLAQIKGNIETSRGRLATAIGIPANTIFEVADLPKNLKYNKIDQSLDTLVQIATENRPDLAAAQAEYLSKKSDIITAVSAGLPKLNVTGDIQHFHFIHNPTLDGMNYTGRVILDVPIFQGFFHLNRTRRARALAEEALAAIENTQQNIFQDVVTSYYAHTTAVETVRYSDEYLKYAQESYDAILSTYKEGVSTILDLLAVQGTLSTARSTRITARTQWAISLAALAHATGTLGNGVKGCTKMRSIMETIEKDAKP